MYHFTSSTVQEFQFLHQPRFQSSPIFVTFCFLFFLIGVHPNRHKVSLAVVLICISLVMSECSIFFHVLFGHLHILFGEMSFKSFAHF